MFFRWILVALTPLAAVTAAAQGRPGGTAGGGGRVPAPGVSELRIANQTIPAGGVAQTKFLLTEPKPIMTGTGRVSLTSFSDALLGAAVFSPAGDAYGAATFATGAVSVSVVSPLASLGSSVDYPILILTSRVNASATPGSAESISPGLSLVDPTGAPVPVTQVAGTLTVGGSLFIGNIVPGGGTWPAGAVIRVLGGGFNRGTAITRSTFRIRSYTVVSSAEINLVLDKATSMDSQRIDLTNPDRSVVTYYSYLRGVEPVRSGIPLVAATDPMYPQTQYTRAATQQFSTGINGTILTALSVQNPNQAPAVVRFEAKTPIAGKIAETTVVLNFADRLTRELGELFGRALPLGARIEVTSTVPIQVLGFVADSATGAVTPFVPAPF